MIEAVLIVWLNLTHEHSVSSSPYPTIEVCEAAKAAMIESFSADDIRIFDGPWGEDGTWMNTTQPSVKIECLELSTGT